jgi:hypothetical protein
LYCIRNKLAASKLLRRKKEQDFYKIAFRKGLHELTIKWDMSKLSSAACSEESVFFKYVVGLSVHELVKLLFVF